MDEIIVTPKISGATRNSKPHLFVEIEIGDFLLVNYEHDDLAVDVIELAKSLNCDGEYFIVTCACGDAGCAGIQEGISIQRDLKW